MTGETLYGLWWKANNELGCEVDDWCNLSAHDRAAWDRTAELQWGDGE